MISLFGINGETAVTAMTFSPNTFLAIFSRKLESTPPENATTTPGYVFRMLFNLFSLWMLKTYVR
jgi:hypothetical protein